MPFLVLELLDGESLEKLLSRGPLDERRAWEVVAQITEALAYAHAHGVLHLDLEDPERVRAPRRMGEGPGLRPRGYRPGRGRSRSPRPSGWRHARDDGAGAGRARTDRRTDQISGRWGSSSTSWSSDDCPRSSCRRAERVAVPAGAPPRAQRVLSRTLCRAPSDRYPDAVALLADAAVVRSDQDARSARARRARSRTGRYRRRRWALADWASSGLATTRPGCGRRSSPSSIDS